MRLSVIVPARNEADVLRPCLESLLSQSEPGFAIAEDWELLLVDDGSTDATRSIALDLPHVTVLDPDPLQPGWTGKANAVWTAARKSQGEWLLLRMPTPSTPPATCSEPCTKRNMRGQLCFPTRRGR